MTATIWEYYYWESGLNDIEIALRSAHFRYRGSIEYHDTRDGIVIVAPISGIAQHYMWMVNNRWIVISECTIVFVAYNKEYLTVIKFKTPVLLQKSTAQYDIRIISLHHTSYKPTRQINKPLLAESVDKLWQHNTMSIIGW